ncbi:MAG: hypothetical protein IJ167_00450 [Lachnospiraceae bacterium]|nr:hypothetical protein [Lachnospiraceae bacterium]
MADNRKINHLKESLKSLRWLATFLFLFERVMMKGNNGTKLNEYIKVVVKEFENFKKNLCDKSILVVYRDKETKELDYFTISILGSNYYHLTGLAYKDDDGEKDSSNHFGSKFYQNLSNKKLSADNLKIKDSNTALKIKALPYITQFYAYSKMTGPFNGNGFKLRLDKVIGNPNICLGLRKIGKKEYAPASSLYSDTRDYAKIINQVVAVFVKNKVEASYSEPTYTAKGFDIDTIENDEILKLIKK